ncbi:MAG: thiamine pyrophosphate-dependent enzyme [Candidatus Korobacteraceae bacterium]
MRTERLSSKGNSNTPREKRRPPLPAPVLRQLYRALLSARLASGGAARTQRLTEGMVAAASMSLGTHDVLIPPAERAALRQCQRMAGTSSKGSLQLPPLAPGAHWQVAMAVFLTMGWQQRHKEGAVLALAADDFLSGAPARATIDLLQETSRQKLPVVYLTQTLASRGAKPASELRVGGVPRIPVDGSDTVAIYRVCQEALRRAREGTGPTIVDCHLAGRTNDVEFLEAFLQRYGLWSLEWKRGVMQELRESKAKH